MPLTQHDVLGDSLHVITLAVGGGLHEDVDGLLEGASHETSQVLSVDSVTRDGHQVTLGDEAKATKGRKEMDQWRFSIGQKASSM